MTGRPVPDDRGQVQSDDLRELRPVRGGRPGDRYVKVVEPYAAEFRRRAPGHLVACHVPDAAERLARRGAAASGTPAEVFA